MNAQLKLAECKKQIEPLTWQSVKSRAGSTLTQYLSATAGLGLGTQAVNNSKKGRYLIIYFSFLSGTNSATFLISKFIALHMRTTVAKLTDVDLVSK
jgi:hypothetical protein